MSNAVASPAPFPTEEIVATDQPLNNKDPEQGVMDSVSEDIDSSLPEGAKVVSEIPWSIKRAPEESPPEGAKVVSEIPWSIKRKPVDNLSPEVLTAPVEQEKKPLTQKELKKYKGYYKGTSAVRKVEAIEGTLTEHQKFVVESEGYVDAPYLDSVGVVTVGVGQTEGWMDKTFKETYDAHMADADKVIPKGLPSDVDFALKDMAFNMGTDRFNSTKWPSLFKALGKNPIDLDEVADAMVDSTWYKQTGRRAKKLVSLVRTGKL